MLEYRVDEFLDQLSSGAPVPGGGGAACLAGALGAALGSMVAALTEGKKRYACYEEDIQRLKRDCLALKDELSRLMEEDARAFEPLAVIYRTPKAQMDPKEREEKLEKALQAAAQVPLKGMQAACLGLDYLSELEGKGSRLALSDVGCGAALIRAGIEACWLNVAVNTKQMIDKEAAGRLQQTADVLRDTGCRKAAEIYEKVAASLRRP